MQLEHQQRDPGLAEALAAVCARAFIDNPTFVAVLPDRSQRARALPQLFAVPLRYGLLAGALCSTDGQRDVAVWLPSQRMDMGWWGALRSGAFQLIGRVAAPVLAQLQHIDQDTRRVHRRCAARPHVYLSLVAVDPHCHRAGRARRLLGSALQQFDARDLPAYLETTVADNVPLFERFGFVVVERFDAGPDVPHWAMWRDPDPASPSPAA